MCTAFVAYLQMPFSLLAADNAQQKKKVRSDPLAALAAEAKTFAGDQKSRTRSGQARSSVSELLVLFSPDSSIAVSAKKAAPIKRTKTMAAVTEESKV